MKPNAAQPAARPAAPTLAAQVIVFAKAPVAGQAKTRLIPALGAAGAAALAERLLDHAVAQALAAGLGRVGLCVTPDARHPAFQRLQARHALRITLQGAGDLGQRMDRALSEALTGAITDARTEAPTRVLSDARTDVLTDTPANTPIHPPTPPPQAPARVLLIGSDAPALSAAVLRAAAAALDDADAVLVPALDGGYVLVGLRRPAPALFAGVAWSTGQVMAQTRQRAAMAGLRLAVLPALADIDEPADLLHLHHLPPLPPLPLPPPPPLPARHPA